MATDGRYRFVAVILLAASVAAVGTTLLLVARPWFVALALTEKALFVLPGIALVRSISSRESGWLSAAAFGPILGFGLSSLALLGLWVAGARGAWTLVAAPVLVLPLVPLATRLRDRWPLPATRSADLAGIAAVILIVPLVTSLPFAHVGERLEAGRAYRAYFTADYVWRRAVVAELAKGDVLPVNPFYRNDPLHYYWLPHLASAVTYRNVPATLDEVLLVHSVTIDVLFVAFLYGLARWFVSASGAAVAGVSAAILSSSFEGIYALWDYWSHNVPVQFVRDLNIDAVARWYFQTMPIDGLQRVLFYQPHHAVGYAIGFLGVLAVTERRRRFDPSAMAVGGLLLGLSTAISSFAGLMLTATAALWEAGSVLRWREWWRAVVHASAAALPLILAAALITALDYVDEGGQIISVGPNRVAFHRFWLGTMLSFGPVLPIAAFAAWAFGRTRDQRGWMFASLALTCTFFYFMVDIRDHQDVYVGWRVGHLWFIATCALGAVAYRWLATLRPRLRWALGAPTALVVLAGLPTTVIDIYNTQDVTNVGQAAGFKWTLILSPDELEAFDWITAHTAPDAVFQVDPIARDVQGWAYLPAFAERRMAVGLPISMVPLQKYETGSSHISWMFETGSAQTAHDLAVHNGIQYLLIGAPERQRHPTLQARLDHAEGLFEKAFSNGEVAVYHVRNVTDTSHGTPVRHPIVPGPRSQARDPSRIGGLRHRQVPVLPLVVLGTHREGDVAAVGRVRRVVAPQSLIGHERPAAGFGDGLEGRGLGIEMHERQLAGIGREGRAAGAAAGADGAHLSRLQVEQLNLEADEQLAGPGEVPAVGRGRRHDRPREPLRHAIHFPRVEPHAVDLAAAVALAREEEAPSIGGPRRVLVRRPVIGQPLQGAAIGVHHPDVDVAAAGPCGGERDPPPIGRPGRVLVEPVSRGADAADGARGHVDHEEPRRPFPVGLEDELSRRSLAFARGYLRQKAMRCQPKGRTQDRGSVLKAPTKHVL